MVRLTRSGGFGSSYTLTVYGDGKVIYGDYNDRSHATSITEAEVEELRTAVEEANLFTPTKLVDMWTDSPLVILAVRMDGKCKAVMYSTIFSDVPPALTALEHKVDEVAYPKAWLEKQKKQR